MRPPHFDPSTPWLLTDTWTYRRFNPAFVSGNQTPEEDTLIVADNPPPGIVLTLNPDATRPTGLVGTIEWQGGGLDLRGTDRGSGFDIVGTGRPGTDTNGWEYRYDGYLISPLPHANDERPTLVGSVIRAKPHGDRKAGEVFPLSR